MERYKIIQKLGEGTFGCVWKAIDMEDGEVVAVKIMKRKYFSLEECLNLPELKSLRKMNHAHIVKLKGVINEHGILYCVFEYMDCNLHQLMKFKEKGLSEEQIRTWSLQVLQGLAYMHQQGYFHRDLKPENLLLSKNGIKIGDLGSAREIKSSPPYTEYVTTRWYRAPEVLLHSREYSSAVDMWAMGAIMAELFTSRPLFPGSSESDQLYKICTVLGTPTNNSWLERTKRASALNYRFPQCDGVPFYVLIPSASKDAIDLIQMLCSWDPSKRPTALEALQHPFFQSFYNMPRAFGYRPSVHMIPPSGMPYMVVTNKGSNKNNSFSKVIARPRPRYCPLIPPPIPPPIPRMPYMVVTNQGINKNNSFSKVIARPLPRYCPPIPPPIPPSDYHYDERTATIDEELKLLGFEEMQI